MRVLVAGANGSTGRRVVRRLREGPHDPVAMIRDGAIRLADAAEELGRSGRVPRDDVADVLVACLDHENTDDRTFEILDGDTPVADALAAL